MKENKYDDPVFFSKYSSMTRSKNGLSGAGEWHELKQLLPNFKGKRVLDLGCGFGWHCRYAAEQGAASVLGIDISEKMLEKAKKLTASNSIKYQCASIEDVSLTENSFDIVISSLAFHYVESFEKICSKVYHSLCTGGSFVFSVEHPIFTSYGTQDWQYGADGAKLHWPVDNYFYEGKRTAVFLEEPVIKYHKTLTTYITNLLRAGFTVTNLVEPMPEAALLTAVPEMKEELRRPMMLLISAKKA